MRIDYSEPKQSYVGGQANKTRPRKEPASIFTAVAVVAGLFIFLAGFGTGWFFSQRAAKKSFQAAIEQKSLENSPKEIPPPAPVAAKPAPPQADAATGQPQTNSPQPGTAGQSTPAPPLSFYKTLPSGQQSNVLGSGINAGEAKPKQPLQAAIPSNVVSQQQAAVQQKPAADKPVATEKPAAKSQDNGGFAVQIASYSLKSEAEAVRSRLYAKGYNVHINESNQGDKGIWYRVRVGKRLDQDAAKELAVKLGKGAMVIPDRD